LSFLTLVGWALFLGVLTGRSELIVVAVPLVVALLIGRRTGAVPAPEVDHTLSADRLLEEERVTVTVRLRAGQPARLVEVLEPRPARVRVVSGSPRAFFTLRADEEVRWEFALRCTARQRLRLDGPYLRLWGPLGLAAAETRYQAPHRVAV